MNENIILNLKHRFYRNVNFFEMKINKNATLLKSHSGNFISNINEYDYIYFNSNFEVSRLDGYAFKIKRPGLYLNKGFYINGTYENYFSFAEATNHLTCNYCEKFCKQSCFI